MHTTLRDTSGRVIGYLDSDAPDAIRDVNAKPIAHRAAGDDKPAKVLSENAAAWMSGRTVLMDLAPGDVATAATVEDLGIPALECVCDEVSPVKLIGHDRGVEYVQAPANAAGLPLPLSGSVGSPPVINPTFSPVNFVTTGYGLAAKLSRQVVGAADFNIRARTLHTLIELLKLAREYRVASLLTTSSNFASSNVVAAIAKWNGGVTANPLIDTFTALATSLIPASAIVMPERAAPYFFQNANSTAMRDYVQSGGPLPKVIPARARYGASSPVYVWAPSLPASVSLVRTGGPGEVTTSRTLRWLGDKDLGRDAGVTDGMLVRSFYVGSDDAYWLVAAHSDAELLLSNRVGAVVTGALA